MTILTSFDAIEEVDWLVFSFSVLISTSSINTYVFIVCVHFLLRPRVFTRQTVTIRHDFFNEKPLDPFPTSTACTDTLERRNILRAKKIPWRVYNNLSKYYSDVWHGWVTMWRVASRKLSIPRWPPNHRDTYYFENLFYYNITKKCNIYLWHKGAISGVGLENDMKKCSFYTPL